MILLLIRKNNNSVISNKDVYILCILLNPNSDRLMMICLFCSSWCLFFAVVSTVYCHIHNENTALSAVKRFMIQSSFFIPLFICSFWLDRLDIEQKLPAVFQWELEIYCQLFCVPSFICDYLPAVRSPAFCVVPWCPKVVDVTCYGWGHERWPDRTKWKGGVPAIYINTAFCYDVYFPYSGLAYLCP